MSDSYIGKSPQYGYFSKQTLSAPIGGSAITLNATAADTRQLIVVVGGVVQEPETAYTLNTAGTQLTFTATPDTALTGWIIWMGKQTTGPRIQADSITAQAALGTSPADADTFVLYDDTASDLKKVAFSDMKTAMGDITGVAAGTGLSGGGTAGDVTLAVDYSTIGAGGTYANFRSTGIDDNADALAVTIDSSENVGVGETVPLGKVHIKSGDAGSIAPETGADDLVLESNTHAGLSIYSGNTSFGNINFGDDGHDSIGQITYDHSTNDMSFTTNTGTGRMTIDTTGYVGLQIAVPTSRLHLYEGTATGTHVKVENTAGTVAYGVSAAGAGEIFTSTADDLNFQTNSVQRLSIKSAGDIENSSQAYFPESTLSFNATQTWDCRPNQVTRVVLTANVTFSAPTNQKDGCFYSIMVEQDGTGGRTGSWNTVFKWAAATAPTLTTTASAKDIFVFRSDGTNMYEVGRQLNVS